MELSQIIASIYELLQTFIPLFRGIWIVAAILGICMILVALILKKNPSRKKSPWIVGGAGLLMMMSSGIQLIVSFF